MGCAEARLVADVAQAHPTPQARQQVHRLLATESVASMADVAPWGDQVRNCDTAPWHLLNIANDACHYVGMHDSSEGALHRGGHRAVGPEPSLWRRRHATGHRVEVRGRLALWRDLEVGLRTPRLRRGDGVAESGNASPQAH